MLELRRFLSVLPARAGMILGQVIGDDGIDGAPRTSGDDPGRAAPGAACAECSPHERG